MALTRAQLLMGNDQQGAVLPGEVQAVKQGAGIFIDTDGTISVDASSVTGLVKLNSLSAFNSYVWPNARGGEGQMLTMGTGNNLVWTNGGVFVNSNPPANPEIGDLWFDCGTGQLLVYEACTSGSPKWTSGSEGLPVLPGDTSASPAFVSGNGTIGDPYICSASSASVSGAIVVNRVTIIGLAPFQFVPIIDLNAVVNGGRFSASNNVANGSGILIFDLLFNDSPTSGIGVTYTCALKIGYGSVYINAPVTMTDVFVLNSAGTISGVPQVGLPLTYTPGTAAGGAPPYTPSWVWKRFGDSAVLQTNGTTYTPPAGEFGNSVFVTLTIQDSEGQIISGSTADYGPIARPPFPNPTPPTVPTIVGTTSCFAWDGTATDLQSDGCLLFSVNGGSFSQGPTPVGVGANVCTKWSDTAPTLCGNAPSGTFIEGCLFDTSFSSCSSLVINRIPNAFSILPEGNVTPGDSVTSFPVTITGNDAPAFLTVGPGSDGSNYQASINLGPFVTVPPSGTYTLSILPGQSLALRFTTGSAAETPYTFNIQVGDSTGNITEAFVATTGTAGFPTTQVTFPTATAGTGSVGTSVPWGNGTMNIQGTGCIEFSLDGVAYTQAPTQIINGDILRTRYTSGASCGDNTNGQTISGGITNGVISEGTSLIINRVPTAFPAWGDLTNEGTLSQYTSNTVTPTGFNSTAYVTLAAGATLTGVQVAIGGGSFTAVPASGATSLPIQPGQNIQVRATTGATPLTTYSATIEIGVAGNVITDTWSVSAGAAAPSVDTPLISSPSNGAVGVGTGAGVTFNSTAFVSRDGAGTLHASSDWESYIAGSFPIETSEITNVQSTPAYVAGVSSRSLRFIAGNQTTFTRAFASAGVSRQKWTWSSWVHRAKLSTGQGIFVQGDVATDQANLQLSNATNQIIYTDQQAGSIIANLVTTASFLDCSQWFHIQLAVDTTSFVTARRIRLYINGQEIVNFSTAIYYTQGFNTTVNTATTFCIGANGVARTNYLDSYMTEVNFVDGQQLAPTSFGASSGGVWIPKPYSGTFGTTGFQLLFEDQGTPSSTTIGHDTSGNNNDFTPNNVQTVENNTIDFDPASTPTTVDILLVGGGGGGKGSSGPGGGAGAGGGGGGVVETTGYSLTTGRSYSVFVGTGGTAGNDFTPSGNGLMSRFANRLAGGGNIVSGAGGRGNWSNFCTNPGGPGIPGLGAGGGTGFCPGVPQGSSGPNSGGGGGGGGASGTAGTTSNGGNGTSSSISGAPVVYGGGGGGGSSLGGWSCPYPFPATAGIGGGGNNSQVGPQSAPFTCPPFTPPPAGFYDGVDGLGGGGGAGRGGSGTVILSYPDTFSDLTRIGSSLTQTKTTSGGRKIYTFTASSPVPNQINNLPDAPAPGGVPSTGLGNEVSGTYNILDPNRTSTISVGAGGLQMAPNNTFIAGTVPITNGKYYWEIQQIPGTETFTASVGVTNSSAGTPAGTNSYRFNIGDGTKTDNTNTTSPYGSAPFSGGVVGVAFDADEGKIWFSVNGVFQAMGNPLLGLNAAFTGLTAGPFYTVVGGTGGTVGLNFGQMPYVHQAPTGFGPVVSSQSITTLTFFDDTNLSNMTVGDSLEEVGGGAIGVVSGVDVGAKQLNVSSTQGTWTIGNDVVNLDIIIPAPAPDSDPPDPMKYSLVDSVTGSAVNKTSWTVTKPPLDPFSTYYTRVKYTSNAPVTSSEWSPWNQITTGNL